MRKLQWVGRRESPNSNGTQRFVAVFTRASLCFPHESDESSPQLTTLRLGSTLMLSSHVLYRRLFVSSSPNTHTHTTNTHTHNKHTHTHQTHTHTHTKHTHTQQTHTKHTPHTHTHQTHTHTHTHQTHTHTPNTHHAWA